MIDTSHLYSFFKYIWANCKRINNCDTLKSAPKMEFVIPNHIQILLTRTSENPLKCLFYLPLVVIFCIAFSFCCFFYISEKCSNCSVKCLERKIKAILALFSFKVFYIREGSNKNMDVWCFILSWMRPHTQLILHTFCHYTILEILNLFIHFCESTCGIVDIVSVGLLRKWLLEFSLPCII